MNRASSRASGTAAIYKHAAGAIGDAPRELILGEIVAEATLDAVEPDESGVPVDEPARQVRAGLSGRLSANRWEELVSHLHGWPPARWLTALHPTGTSRP